MSKNLFLLLVAMFAMVYLVKAAENVEEQANVEFKEVDQIMGKQIAPFSKDKLSDFHVSHEGRDDNPGTRSKPFATLERARDAVREMRGNSKEPVTVWIAPGDYRLNASFELGSHDSYTTYCGYPGQERDAVRISGGITINITELPFLKNNAIRDRLPTEVRDKVRVIDLKKLVPAWEPEKSWPDAFRGYAGWPELFIDNEAQHLARWPNTGYVTIAEVTDRGSRPRFEEKPDRPGSFLFTEPEPATWSTGQEIFLSGYWAWKWYDETLRVKSIDREKKEIHFAAPHHYGIGGASKGLYFSINVLETLDQPGEYVYDRKAGKIYLLPPDGGRCLTVSLLDAPLFKIEKASGITIRGLTMESGLGVAALELNDCTEVVIEDCLLRNFAQDGVVIKGGSKCGVRHTELTRLGKGGVILDGGDRLTLTPGGHFVTDCEIHHYARILKTYQAAVSLGGVGHLVAYNYIHHAPHNAIRFGGNDHVIEHNRIEQVLLDTEDAGAIYTGRDWTLHGNIIRKNWFTRLGEGDHHGNFAFYADDQASGITARHNIVVDCSKGALYGGGRDCVIEENLFVNAGPWLRFDTRGLASWSKGYHATLQQGLAAVPVEKEPWRSRFPTLVGLAKDEKRHWPAGNTITGNIAVNCDKERIDDNVKKSGKVSDNRIIDLQGWKPRMENGNVIYPDGGPELPEELKSLKVGPRKKEE